MGRVEICRGYCFRDYYGWKDYSGYVLWWYRLGQMNIQIMKNEFGVFNLSDFY